jgi:hypothetical protein
MHLILCASFDLPALWAYEGLRAAGLDSVELITSETFAGSRLWEHRLGTAGIDTSFRLPDGRTVLSQDIRGVLNRLLAPPQELISRVAPADQDYALQELTAFYLSWLNALPCPVFNRPTPQGLAGRWRHASEWALIAHEAGLAVPTYRQDSHDPAEAGYGSLAPSGACSTRVIVLDTEVFGAMLPEGVRGRCLRVAELSETALLGIDLFAARDDPWTFAGATPFPDLQIGGDLMLRRLHHVFQNRGKY